MKSIYLLIAASLFIASCGPTTVIHSDNYQPAPAPPPVMDVTYQSFYDQLSPYGNWVSYPGYGYVWMPNAGPDFRPYSTNGNWIYTDAGWTWSSNYNWGWAPFHYGRWFFENGYGWMWLPGNEWAPAWVSWRGNGDYYGWAPLGPRVSVEVAMSSYNPPAYYWNFVPRQYMGNPGWHSYHVQENRNVTIINNTTIIHNYSGTNRNRYAYAPGPDPNEVRRVTGHNFAQVQLREANTPGERVSGSQYTIYQPRVNNNAITTREEATSRSLSPTPARYESFSNIRPSGRYPDYDPVNNARPSIQNQPNNYPPVNNVRPATQNQPNNYPPVNNTRPSTQNQPNNYQPVNNVRPSTQNHPDNTTPSVLNSTPNQQNATSKPVSDNHMNEVRMNQLNQSRSNPHPVQNPPPANSLPQPSPVNHVQNAPRPANNHNSGQGEPVQRSTKPDYKPVHPNDHKPEVKPVQRPAEKPKSGEADNNNN